MIILNTGGTFNKRYEPIRGELIVPKDNLAIETIVQRFSYKVDIEGIIYKDSLDMDDSDRQKLIKLIDSLEDDQIIIVHGTDTMDITASYLAKREYNKKIVLTGAMVPFFIDEIESTSNLSLSIGYALSQQTNGVYIAMQGVVAPYNKIRKNKDQGIFELI